MASNQVILNVPPAIVGKLLAAQGSAAMAVGATPPASSSTPAAAAAGATPLSTTEKVGIGVGIGGVGLLLWHLFK